MGLDQAEVEGFADSIYRTLGNYRFQYSSEKALQDGIEAVLARVGVHAEREYRLDGDPIDFWVPPGIGIECKIAGGPSAVADQLIRYAKHPEIHSIFLATSRHTHRFSERLIMGKDFRVIWVARNL